MIGPDISAKAAPFIVTAASVAPPLLKLRGTNALCIPGDTSNSLELEPGRLILVRFLPALVTLSPPPFASPFTVFADFKDFGVRTTSSPEKTMGVGVPLFDAPAARVRDMGRLWKAAGGGGAPERGVVATASSTFEAEPAKSCSVGIVTTAADSCGGHKPGTLLSSLCSMSTRPIRLFLCGEGRSRAIIA